MFADIFLKGLKAGRMNIAFFVQTALIKNVYDRGHLLLDKDKPVSDDRRDDGYHRKKKIAG